MADVRMVFLAPDELRELIAEAVRTAAPQAKYEEWVDGRTSGLGRRLFLRLAHEGAFPIFKRGRSYVARRADVDAHIERHRVEVELPPKPEPPKPRPQAAHDPVAAALAAGRLHVVKKPP